MHTHTPTPAALPRLLDRLDTLGRGTINVAQMPEVAASACSAAAHLRHQRAHLTRIHAGLRTLRATMTGDA